MRHFAKKMIWIAATSVLACAACVSTVGPGAGGTDAPAPIRRSAHFYGDEHAVQATIGAIKLRGNQGHISSRAIRLPERPLGAIAVFGYQFPANCGGHEFRVLEAGGTQILEYQYAAQNGDTHMIRDYITGPGPFVKPGLWTAYDHTAGSVSTMTSRFEQRSGGTMNGVYSQGLVTNLPASEQRVLGSAYQKAISDAYACHDTHALADTLTQ